MQAKVRIWFLRNAVETLERAHGPSAAERLRREVPRRLAAFVSVERLRSAGMLEVIPIEEAEDTLFSIDAMFGQGAGQSMEAVAMEVVSKSMGSGSVSVNSGDLLGTLVRLRSLIESPFVDTNVTFELTRTPSGFSLVVGIPGRPRATRLLRYFATGTVLAAARFAREPGTEQLRVTSESMVDRSVLKVVYREVAEKPPLSWLPPPRASRPPPVPTRLADHVERILAPLTTPPGAGPDEPTPPPKSESVSQRPSTPVTESPPLSRRSARPERDED